MTKVFKRPNINSTEAIGSLFALSSSVTEFTSKKLDWKNSSSFKEINAEVEHVNLTLSKLSIEAQI